MESNFFKYYKEFLSKDIQQQSQDLCQNPASFWQKVGENKALDVFYSAAERVPAYKHFLEKHKIKPSNIKSIKDFNKLPTMDKYKYINVYPIHELCWDGRIDTTNVVSTSSGSTGQPFFWARDSWQEREVVHFFELIFSSYFSCHETPTLVVISFAMGMYIGGPITFSSCMKISEKGYPIIITTPGIDVDSALKAIQKLSSEVEQIVIAGYPPLVRDIIYTGKKINFNWASKNTKLIMAGEGFSERWRDYINQDLGSSFIFSSIINMYGSADSALT